MQGGQRNCGILQYSTFMHVQMYIVYACYHYTKVTFVRPSVTCEREVTGSHSTRNRKLSFWELGHYNRQPTDTTGYGLSRDYTELLQKDGGVKLDVYTYIRRPGERTRATFWSRCCP